MRKKRPLVAGAVALLAGVGLGCGTTSSSGDEPAAQRLNAPGVSERPNVVLGRAGDASWKTSLTTAYRTATEPTAMLDTVTPAQVRMQIDSSLETLSKVSGIDVSDAAAIRTVPVDRAANAYGFEIDIAVPDITKLQPYAADVFLGLSTGLIGGPMAVVEGLAIDVSDRHGRKAGVWQTSRTGSATAQGDTGFSVNDVGAVHATYPNLLGGPVRTESVSSHPGSLRR